MHHLPLAYVPVAPASMHYALYHTAWLSLSPSFLGWSMSQGVNFNKVVYCKSEINLSEYIKETTNKHMSGKRLNGAPDMIVMASTKLRPIYRLSVDLGPRNKKKDVNSGRTPDYVLSGCKFCVMNTLLLQLDYMDTKNESDSQRMLLGGLLKGKKG